MATIKTASLTKRLQDRAKKRHGTGNWRKASFVYVDLVNRRRCTCICIDFVKQKAKTKKKVIHDDEPEDNKGSFGWTLHKRLFVSKLPFIPGTPFPEVEHVGVVLW
jgi:hypothetical protein